MEAGKRVRMKKLINGEATDYWKDDKSGSELVIGWIRKFYNKAFESSIGPKDRRSAVTVPLYKGKWRLSGLLYTDDLVLRDVIMKGDFKEMTGRLVVVCKRNGRLDKQCK